MTILLQATMLVEFMFQGYCQYIYFSALMENKRKTKIALLLFLLASCMEYYFYINYYTAVSKF